MLAGFYVFIILGADMPDIFWQLLWNGLVSGSLLALVALGLTLIYGIGGFLQFAHGEMVALGAYVFLTFHKFLGMDFWGAGILTVVVMVLIGGIMERVFFRPVRERDAFVPLVVAIGLSIAFQSLILMFFGAGVWMITDQTFESISLLGGKLLMTPNQILALMSTLLLVGGLHIFLLFSRTGKSIRAVSCNRALSEVFGMNVDRAMMWIFVIGTVLAGMSGVFVGFEQNLTPLMGVHMAIRAFAAVVLGGVGSVRGAIVGAFLIGLAENFLVGFGVIPSGFTTSIAFVILIGMLLVWPQGLFGRREEILRR